MLSSSTSITASWKHCGARKVPRAKRCKSLRKPVLIEAMNDRRPEPELRYERFVRMEDTDDGGPKEKA
jgi:hypothetical protein